MSMNQFDEYKVKLNGMKPKLDGLSDSLNLGACAEELERLHAQIESPGFWDNQAVSQQVMKRSRQLEAKIDRYNKMQETWDDMMTIIEMAQEENDESMLEDLIAGYADLEEKMEALLSLICNILILLYFLFWQRPSYLFSTVPILLELVSSYSL